MINGKIASVSPSLIIFLIKLKFKLIIYSLCQYYISNFNSKNLVKLKETQFNCVMKPYDNDFISSS